jgi:hypothetical protein
MKSEPMPSVAIGDVYRNGDARPAKTKNVTGVPKVTC